MEKKNSKKILFGVLGFAVVVLALFLVYNQFVKDPVAGEKKIVAEVILTDGTSTSFDIQTDEEFLRGALQEIDLIEGTESEYGLFVLTVNGITANDTKQEWWAFSKDGESLMTGVDTTPIEDGDHYEITLTVGY
jgi:hypothetical protein